MPSDQKDRKYANYSPSRLGRVGPSTHHFFEGKGDISEVPNPVLLDRLELLYFDDVNQRGTLVQFRSEYCKPRARASVFDLDATKNAEAFLRKMADDLSFPLTRANIVAMVNDRDALLRETHPQILPVSASNRPENYGLDALGYRLLRFALIRCGPDAKVEFLKGFLLDIWLKPYHDEESIGQLLEQLEGKASGLRLLPSSRTTKAIAASSLDQSTTGQLSGLSEQSSVPETQPATTQTLSGTVRSAGESFGHDNSGLGSPPSKKVRGNPFSLPESASQAISDSQSQSMQPVPIVPDSFAGCQNAPEGPKDSMNGNSVDREAASILLTLFNPSIATAPQISAASLATVSSRSDSNFTCATPTGTHPGPEERERSLWE